MRYMPKEILSLLGVSSSLRGLAIVRLTQAELLLGRMTTLSLANGDLMYNQYSVSSSSLFRLNVQSKNVRSNPGRHHNILDGTSLLDL